MTDKPIGRTEARRILENLSRNGAPTAQIARIKVLLELDKVAAAKAEPEPTDFERAGLYDDEISTKRAGRWLA